MKKTVIIALLTIGCFYNANSQTKGSPCASPSTVSYVRNNRGNMYSAPPVRHNRVFTWTDDMHNPYDGKPSKQNDGVKKNEYRNLNFTTTSTGGELPANDGSK